LFGSSLCFAACAFLLVRLVRLLRRLRSSRNREANAGRQFQTAVAQYNAGRFTEAASQLEFFCPAQTASRSRAFGTGLRIALARCQAIEHLEDAVQLKPRSAAARENLAASLIHAGTPNWPERNFAKRSNWNRATTTQHTSVSLHSVWKDCDGRPLLSGRNASSPLLRQRLRSGDADF